MRRLIVIASLCVFCAFADTKLGQPLTLKESLPVAKVAANPEAYVGQTVQVKGKVSEVCEMMGCWMNLVDPTGKQTVRIKVKDGEIVFPAEAIGKMAIAEGKMVKIEMTKDQLTAELKHEAGANKKKFDPATVTSGKTIFQIQGTGAVVLD
jgi:Domain of unknown function (DUF4920)